ncbi:hypothetical protein CAC42_3983 [Sphaceloma murrayae]|uniref:Uncharacterized protein n=1 Tax=Sphaceloma murrayae TaxID=2082308 RepID=A0A2K1QSG6_9PEZI|nr:hypothetical protein CAC42_3983 [Sphaceloma murrayae]
MFYDLNVPWTSATDPELPRTLAFLAELGYDVVALNHTLSGKLPPDLTCPIPSQLPFPTPKKLKILRRLTLPLTAPLSNARLKALSSSYDLLALRPVDEKTFQACCSTLDGDMISLDLSQRFAFPFKFKPLSEAAKRGVRIEICYSQGVLGDANPRRNVIGNVTSIVRASRGRGLVVSSEARRAMECRAPWDVINLLAVWGLSQERAYEAVTKEARNIVAVAQLKRTSYRGVVDVIDGGREVARPIAQQPEAENGTAVSVKGGKAEKANGMKRKADEIKDTQGEEKPISKRQMKRNAKAAREAALAV